MPPTSEQLPLLGIYYAATTCIVSLSTAMTVLTIHINNKGRRGKDVPQIVKKIFFHYIARFMRIKLESVSSMRLLHKRLLNERINRTPTNSVDSKNSFFNSQDISLKCLSDNPVQKKFDFENCDAIAKCMVNFFF